MIDHTILKHVLPFCWAFFMALFAIPSIVNVAHQKRLLDEPNARTVHELLTPRLGGLAIFAGLISAVTILGKIEYGIQQLLAGVILLFFIGLKDDIANVSAFKKFLIQVLAAFIVVFMADIRIRNFHGILDIYELQSGTSYLFTFMVIIGVTNALNLIDGLDGLAGTMVSIACLTFGLGFALYGPVKYASYASVAFSLMGSVIGFLRYNMYRAKIFMGDTGSLVCGFVLAVLAIQFIEMDTIESASSLSIAILIIPLMDTTRVFLLRMMAGRSPFSPDKNHIHHRLIDIGFSQLAAVLILAFINILAILLVLVFITWPETWLILFIGAYAIFISTIIELAARQKKKQNIRDKSL